MIDIRAEKGPLFTGMYRALVINNGFDPAKVLDSDEKKRGRIQIRVLGVHSFNTTDDNKDGIPDANLPWAEPAGPLMGGYYKTYDKSNTTGVITVPPIGSWVWIWFDNGDHNKPVYFASIPGDTQFQEIDGNTTTIRTRSGHVIKLVDNPDDAEQNTIYVVHADGETGIVLEKGKATLSGTKVYISADHIFTGNSGLFVVLSDVPGPITIPGGGVLHTSTNMVN